MQHREQKGQICGLCVYAGPQSQWDHGNIVGQLIQLECCCGWIQSLQCGQDRDTGEEEEEFQVMWKQLVCIELLA